MTRTIDIVTSKLKNKKFSKEKERERESDRLQAVGLRCAALRYVNEHFSSARSPREERARCRLLPRNSGEMAQGKAEL